MTKELRQLLKLLNGHRVFIQTHNFPDPDAIASAFGLQELLKRFKIESTICYHGTDVRSATASMITLLEIEMFSDKDIKMSPEDYIITVDAQKGNSNILDLDGDEVACIDHHPTFCEAESYRFKDVRIVGSCATIIADYYRQNRIKMPERVATALLYGLKMDTKDFTRSVTQMDIDVFSYLFRLADNKMIRHFQTNVLQYNELESFADSMHSIEIYNGIAFVYLDFPCADAFVATVSDFILDLDAVVFVVVYSRKGNGFKFSVRSELDELDSGAVTAQALKDCGSGGGHRTMAGGY
ncbi:MAG: DHH family phosphoesterase, partial [Oscillospiraceae bacterium]|nr:DHH family phosphoesterase [Oscillospiraceae bacterium]